jgi:hypothetical protein
VSFFELPERPKPEEPALPPWYGPPDDEIGVVIPLERTIATTDRARVSFRAIAAYRQGFTVTVGAWREIEIRDPWEHFPDVQMWHPTRGGDIPEEFLRFGVQFPDGSKATNLDPFPEESGDDAPKSPVLFGHPNGFGRRVELSYWVWPLPAPGPVAFVFEWPSERIPETIIQVEAETIRSAATKARSVWD